MSQDELRIIRRRETLLIRLAQHFCHGPNRAALSLNEVFPTHILTGALANSGRKATFPDRASIVFFLSHFGINKVLA